jgi:hypothetical protein
MEKLRVALHTVAATPAAHHFSKPAQPPACVLRDLAGHRESAHLASSMQRGHSIMFRREVIDKKIVELRRALATTDDELTVALLMMAIESFESERAVLVQAANINDTADAEEGT